jgi:hypothetical protein
LEASKKFSRILWRRPRPKLGCGAKERRRRSYTIIFIDAVVFMGMKPGLYL